MIEAGPLKLAVRRAIAACGGIKLAAHAAGVSETQAGRWHSLNDRDIPTLQHIVEIEELAIASGERPLIVAEIARQLGQVLVPVPDAVGDAAPLTMQLAKATAEFGDVAQAVVAALSDNSVDGCEADGIAYQIDEAMSALARLRSLVVHEETLADGRSAVRGVA